VLLYRPNISLSMLLVGRINRLGKGSEYLRQYLAGSRTLQPHRAQQVRLFFSPTVLDSWQPHFTLLNPYNGHDQVAVASLLEHFTETYKSITVDRLCLLIQKQDEANWQIYREFYRK
jgi:hypothetical protein